MRASLNQGWVSSTNSGSPWRHWQAKHVDMENCSWNRCWSSSGTSARGIGGSSHRYSSVVSPQSMNPSHRRLQGTTSRFKHMKDPFVRQLPVELWHPCAFPNCRLSTRGRLKAFSRESRWGKCSASRRRESGLLK
jgi:hypothetical protein